jgi:UDP-N-acetylmuramate: L-alanyl-gamma-D-glutamyl-meso-diaminopimelate ligase
VLTGIAWDHINVFPTFENYLEQFAIFLDKIETGGTLIYNATDSNLSTLVEKHSRVDLVKIPYGLPDHKQDGNVTLLELEGLQVPLQVFGDHNLLNIHAAWHVCRLLGMEAPTFTNAMKDFTGASKRLEILVQNDNQVVFRDFAHAPSKVKATMQAVKQQFPQRKVTAILELHTYSSLSEAFLPHYAGALDAADAACVFYSTHALEIKRMPPLAPQKIMDGFAKPGLKVLTKREALEAWIIEQKAVSDNLLLMSSGNYDGMDVQDLSQEWINRN